jgi:hypothetical protein
VGTYFISVGYVVVSYLMMIWMSASTSDRRTRKRRMGFEVCAHTCQKMICQSQLKGPLWPQEGSALWHHVKIVKHPGKCYVF